MHIILIGYLHNHGGIQTHTHWLANGLVSRGHSVEAITPGPQRNDPPGLPQNGHYEISEYRTIGDILRIGRKARPRPDAVVVAGTGWKAMTLAYAIKGARRRVFFEVMSGERNTWLDPRDMARIGFHAMVAQGSGVERAFVREFSWCRPHVTIPALPEPLEVEANIPVAPKLPRGGEGKLRLGYFSRLINYKGAGWLIENWDCLSQHAERLDIWGTGPAHDEFAALINKNGLGDRISLKGRYPRGQEYINLLQRYDLTLLPTWGKEGAPLVLLESMACGVPFVANGVGGIPDYANPQSAITSGKLEEFLLLYNDLAARIGRGEIDGEALQEHYRQNFSFERLVDQWEGFLNSPLPAVAGKQQ
ncbi:glycosyltransferase family 4 protein [Henriciella algicola]|uniref:Glycosyltransferase n=1 Tax=Henriciella algicola TaxID=1608422 RepID=A0A399RFD1_9PROT|nr:glycosyltransferase family 4 protein [Henriciella algicola]RIJ29194.1 glycosyltransferase [Henriciella algicola]